MCKALCVFHDLWSKHPPVGVWIGILGLVGVLVPLIWDVTKMDKYKKAAWTFVMFTLLLLEIKSVYQDRNEHDKDQADARERETQSFKEIATGIDASIQQSKEDFDATMASAKKIFGAANESLNQITGGDQFCYLSARRTPASLSSLDFFAVNSGPRPLQECSLRVYWAKGRFEDQHRPLAEETVSNLEPKGFREANGIPGHALQKISNLVDGEYRVDIMTGNGSGHFSETLKIDHHKYGHVVDETVADLIRHKIVYSTPKGP